MANLSRILGSRLLPAVLTAAGVALVTAGLLTYTDPSIAGIPSPVPEPTATSAPYTPPPTASPGTSGEPTPSSSPGVDNRTVTRVAIPALRIDLPVIRQPDPAYPSCNVAMYHEAFGAPGQKTGPYIYAHARTGMFLPLLEASKVNDGRAMVGMLVQVWTSDDRLFLYEIKEVRRHVPTSFNLGQLLDDGPELMWLQTSEGPNSTYPKLQVVATMLSEDRADPADAHPTPHPVNCR
jgi:hypothetical protein